VGPVLSWLFLLLPWLFLLLPWMLFSAASVCPVLLVLDPWLVLRLLLLELLPLVVFPSLAISAR
jgi:hypothetical protein